MKRCGDLAQGGTRSSCVRLYVLIVGCILPFSVTVQSKILFSSMTSTPNRLFVVQIYTGMLK